jgi:Kyakuja-Dileera-Zisupton transposase
MKRAGITPSNEDLKFITDCDHLFSYDISCGYSINAVKRFEQNFPEEADFVDHTRWLIPLVHIQNHKDNCTYQYSSAYIKGACHFQGETAEMPWVELNQLAPQTRQMNNGHRQDTIIDHHSHWNWMKTSNMGTLSSALPPMPNTDFIQVPQLLSDLVRAKRLFLQKHLTFKTLCTVYADSVPEWNSLDRQERCLCGRGRNKEVQCVYRQDDSKGSFTVLNIIRLHAYIRCTFSPLSISCL